MDRGTLRICLGAAPGVGKTKAMLDEGRRRIARGLTEAMVGQVTAEPAPGGSATVVIALRAALR